jgi:hypothetical protein
MCWALKQCPTYKLPPVRESTDRYSRNNIATAPGEFIISNLALFFYISVIIFDPVISSSWNIPCPDTYDVLSTD